MHLSEATVKRVSIVTKEIDTICSTLDNALGIKPKTSVSSGPDDKEDFRRIVKELEAAKVFTYLREKTSLMPSNDFLTPFPHTRQ